MSLECELARVQMKRYLAGEELPLDLQKGLEGHVRACASCRAHLNEQRLKLASDLAGKKASEAAKKALAEKAPLGPDGSKVFAPPSPLRGAFNLRNLALSCCLAGVLFAMSAIAKDPGIIFGPKAAAAKPAATDPHKEESHGNAKDSSHGEAASDHSTPHSSGEPPAHGTQPASEKSGGHDETGETGKEATGHEPSSDSGSAHGVKESEVKEPVSGAHETTVTKEPSHQAEPEPNPSAERPPRPKLPEASAHAPAKPDLLVAEEGSKPKIKKAPAPHPRTNPASAKRRSTPRRKSTPARRTSARTAKPAPAKSSNNSIRVYDAQGNPIR